MTAPTIPEHKTFKVIRVYLDTSYKDTLGELKEVSQSQEDNSLPDHSSERHLEQSLSRDGYQVWERKGRTSDLWGGTVLERESGAGPIAMEHVGQTPTTVIYP